MFNTVGDSGCSELYQLTAMRDRGILIAAVNLAQRRVFFENGVSVPLLEMRDANGVPVKEWKDCVRYDFGDARFGYGTAKADSEAQATH